MSGRAPGDRGRSPETWEHPVPSSGDDRRRPTSRPTTASGGGPRAMRRVLVTGATDLIGANVCEILRARGDDVVALVRDGSDATALVDLGVEIVRGDITVEADVDRAADGVEVIVNSAALLGGPG